jgi:methylated-DNA-[protein]-cysteine S-methyltransferase
MPMARFRYVSPYGVIELSGEEGKLCRVELGCSGGAGSPEGDAPEPFVEMLDCYFRGENILCKPGMLCLNGLSEFRRRVYEMLMDVPFGSVVSYGELAELCGCPHASRAVGGAMAANPLPIFIPCHRVIRAGGGLGGFSAGLDWKVSLLGHEGWALKGGRILARRAKPATDLEEGPRQ